MPEIFIGRQPIYNKDLEIFAYELMSRNSRSSKDEYTGHNDDMASSRLILGAFLDIGIDKLVNDNIAFLRLAEHVLRSKTFPPLSSEKIILKIPDYIKADDDLVEGAHQLRKKGYRLAIDDYLLHQHLQPLAEFAHIIDINIQQLDADQISSHVKQLRKKHSTLLADHVRTYDEYETCRDLGFDYIQGYFLSRPKVMSGASMSDNQLTIMNLLSILHNSETDIDSIDAIISKDVALSYKILKLINSAFFNRANEIESIRHAVVMLGRKQLCSWASLMALTGLDYKPREQVRIAMTRAKNCELLAEHAQLTALDSFFTVGMFSALDLLMDQSLENLITPLPLTDNIIGALLNREGKFGQALNCTLAQETSDWVNIRFEQLDEQQLANINITALNWADEVLNAI
ncbi:MAG: EAL and HDOD domain-containing protein [Gammaproteobacteria bacterium]